MASSPNTRVSILVATRNRPQFIPQVIRNIATQAYPKHLLEVIVADDGVDPIGHLLPSGYIYIRYEKPIPLGQKRQELKTRATGEILVCMDDDDYYPPTRVSSAVATLKAHPDIGFAYAPTLHLYYPHERAVYSSGPWTSNWPHATFAFTKAFADTHHYTEGDAYGEERHFTDFYRVPHLQLKAEDTILALCHNHNTIPKNRLGKRALLGFDLRPYVRDGASLQFYAGMAGRTGGPVVMNPGGQGAHNGFNTFQRHRRI